jgi:hypothetical protein
MKAAVIQYLEFRHPALQVVRQVISQIPVAFIRFGESDYVPKNAFFSQRQFIRHMSWHHLDPTQPPSICQHNGPVRAYLGSVEARDFESVALRTFLRKRRKPPRRG